MALWDNDMLKFDIVALDGMIKELDASKEALKMYKTDVVNRISELKNTWKTPTGNSFIQSVDTNWGRKNR